MILVTGAAGVLGQAVIATLVARGEAVDLQALLRRADGALYAAKRGGRNRVVGSAGTDGAMDLNCDAVA